MQLSKTFGKSQNAFLGISERIHHSVAVAPFQRPSVSVRFTVLIDIVSDLYKRRPHLTGKLDLFFNKTYSVGFENVHALIEAVYAFYFFQQHISVYLPKGIVTAIVMKFFHFLGIKAQRLFYLCAFPIYHFGKDGFTDCHICYYL